MGVFSAVEHIFNETAMHAKAQESNRMAKANRASHGPRVSPHSLTQARVKRASENPKENPEEPKVRTKVPKAYTKAKHRKLVSEVLKTRIRRQAQTFRNLHKHVPLTIHGTTAGVSMKGTMAGVVLNGMKIVNEHMTHL